jgi:hypothetical protein
MSSTEEKGREEVNRNVHIPTALYEQIKTIADQELRSINAQMIKLLQSAVASYQRQQRRESLRKEK